jgi:hypothetical protein
MPDRIRSRTNDSTISGALNRDLQAPKGQVMRRLAYKSISAILGRPEP